MKICAIIGARPQFIKSAFLYKKALQLGIDFLIVNTGQHYDYSMSKQFFTELDIPEPAFDLALDVQASKRDENINALEATLKQINPDLVFVIGDTESTFIGARAAQAAGYKSAHIEAGLRCFHQTIEEKIRVEVDHICDLLLCPNEQARMNLFAEGIDFSKIAVVGDILQEALYYALDHITKPIDFGKYWLMPCSYVLATIHRKETIENKVHFIGVLDSLNLLQYPVFFPIHPHTRKMIPSEFHFASNVIPIEPASYLEMVNFERTAALIITDSGGVQREAFWLGRPLLVARFFTEWPEMIDNATRFLVGTNPFSILIAARKAVEAHEEKKKILFEPSNEIFLWTIDK